MSLRNEKKDLERLRKGDQASFERIYYSHHPKVYGFCLKLISDRQIAEEITEDAFVKLWEKRQNIDPALPIGPFLFKITKDYIWNHLKKISRETKRREQYSSNYQASDPRNPEQELIFNDYLDFAETAIENLPEKRKLIYNLHYRSGLESREIASRLDISESTVRVHLMKARQFLHKYLKTHLEIPFWLLLLLQ